MHMFVENLQIRTSFYLECASGTLDAKTEISIFICCDIKKNSRKLCYICHQNSLTLNLLCAVSKVSWNRILFTPINQFTDRPWRLPF